MLERRAGRKEGMLYSTLVVVPHLASSAPALRGVSLRRDPLPVRRILARLEISLSALSRCVACRCRRSVRRGTWSSSRTLRTWPRSELSWSSAGKGRGRRRWGGTSARMGGTTAESRLGIGRRQRGCEEGKRGAWDLVFDADSLLGGRGRLGATGGAVGGTRKPENRVSKC